MLQYHLKVIRQRQRRPTLPACAEIVLLLLWGLVMSASFTLAQVASAADLITVMYYDKPPSLVTHGEQIEGAFYLRAQRALTSAGLNTLWVKTPPLRQFDLLKKNTPLLCAANWYATPERRKIAYISVAVTHFPPLVLVSRRNDRRFTDPMSLNALLDNDLRLATGIGFSMGEELDKLAKNKRLHAIYSHGEDVEMLKEVIAQRADYVFLFADAAEPILNKVSQKSIPLSVHTLTDMPPATTAHLLCSFAIGRRTMDKIDAALQAP